MDTNADVWAAAIERIGDALEAACDSIDSNEAETVEEATRILVVMVVALLARQDARARAN